MNLKVSLDHLVIAAADLSSGVEYVNEILGVKMPYGGEHEKMGTQNHLMSLGSDVFLEIIAINPKAQQPNRPRWYGLDDPYLRSQIAKQPQLIAWVVNTTNINQLLSQADFDFGSGQLLSRGDLNWYFALPEDGRLHGSGLIPYVMQWNTDSHPARLMLDLGCRLQKLRLYHANSSWLASVLKQIEVGGCELIEVVALEKNQTPYMSATIATPSGVKELASKV